MNYYDNDIYHDELEHIIKKNGGLKYLNNKSIVITGARGLIGSMLIDAIMYANEKFGINCNIYAIVRNQEQSVKRFNKYMRLPLLKIIKADINHDDIDIKSDIDFFVHGASNTHPVYYSSKPIETILTNTIGTNKVLEFSIKHKCKRFIFLSSVEIYGENRGDTESFSENYCGYIDCNTLRAGYPEGKRLGEALCQAYRKEKNLDCIILRVARCYGAGLLKNDSKALSQFLRNVLNGEDIILKSKGNQYYSYVYVADAVDSIFFAIKNGKDGEAYNVNGKESNITLKELAKLVAEDSNGKVTFDLPDKSEIEGFSKVTKAILNCDKFRKVGWQGNYTIREGIKRTLKMMKEQDDRGTAV